jgi:hypothetical protein
MRSYGQSTSPSGPSSPPPPPSSSPPSIFSPGFLARMQARDEAPTASAAELAGPWRTEPVPGRPGSAAVLRVWESGAEGDVPRAVFDEEETARLFAVALPLLGRGGLLYLGEEGGVQGFAAVTVDGEQGPRQCGALALYEPEALAAAGLLQELIRSPAALAEVVEVAGPGALVRVGRILARRFADAE